MKIFAVFMLVFILSAAYTAVIDLFRGSRVLASLKHLKSPFAVMAAPEYFIMLLFLSLMFLPALISFLKQRKQALTKKKT